MEQYEEWPDEDENFPENYPTQNIIVSEIPNQNQFQYRINPYMSSNNISQGPQIYPSKGQIIQQRNKYINYNTNNPNSYYNINNQINSNYNYNQRVYYKSPNNITKKSSNNNYDKFTKYESSDGVLRGYTNNFSFYESNSSKIKPKVINDASNQYNNSNNLQYNYQRANITQDSKIRYHNNINNNRSNRQIININENENNGPYIIRVIEDEPVEYVSPNIQYDNNYNDMNYINNNNENNYYYNETEEQNFRPPAIQRRMVKRVIHKQPNSQREEYYIVEPQNINNYNNQNFGYRKVYSYDINKGNDINSYQQPLRRNNTPKAKYSNYSRPIKQIRYIIPNHSENNIFSEPYNDKYSYKTFTDQNNDYIITRVENDFPRNRSPFLGPSPNINNNRNNEYMLQNQFRPKQREYTSRTEKDQGGYEYEYDEDDDVYEVPEQYNKRNIINNKNRDYNEERRQNNFSDRPFTRVNNYSQAVRNGKKYGVYTQTLEMNRNYYSNNNGEEYEYEVPNNSRNNRIKENYSQPKIMKPINDVQRLLKNKREYSAFERSLRNIRNNEEEIELENEARNNRIRSKAKGEKNIRFISNNSGRPSREYKTFTEQEDNRKQEQGYILQDIDDSNFEDYDTYQNQSYKNIEINPNEITETNRMQKQYKQGKDYYERAQMENIENYGDQEIEEDDDNDGEGQMYDSSKLITDKKDNFGIVQNNIEKESINNPDINDEEVNLAQIQINDGEIEDQRNIENNGIYRREDIPEDRDEEGLSNGKKLKNIQTEICEKYYDNQGNYLGEKKIITTNQIPKEEYLQQGEEYYEEQEEIEENENEYTPYQSSNKKFKKRGENNVRRGQKADNDMNKNQNLKMNMNKESKYQSYYGDSNNNVYHEIKKAEKDSKNEKEICNKKYKQPITLVKNVTFGIHSENLCVPADDNETDNNNIRESEKQRNTKSNANNDEKEADEQQIEENVVIEEDEEQNQMTLNPNDRNNNLPIEQDINENINDNDNDNNGESENINEDKNIESQNSEQNYNYNYIEESNLNNDDENNYDNYRENNNFYEENINMSDKNGEYNMRYENGNEEERIYEENEAEEIENQNIQKDKGEKEDIDEGLVDREQENNYNYQQEQENDYEGNQNYDEEGEEMEQREEYNIIEEDSTNREIIRHNKEENW